jgi:hypothetical protein
MKSTSEFHDGTLSSWEDRDHKSRNITTLDNEVVINEIGTNSTQFPDFANSFMDTVYAQSAITSFHTPLVLSFSIVKEDRRAFYRLTRQILADVTQDNEAFQAMLATEHVLKEIWDTPEEDEAWSHL